MKILKIILIFFCFQSFAQSKKIDAYIKKIDNSQFSIVHGTAATFSMSSPAAFKLIKIGKRATAKLIMALNDSTKTIMAHLVLCHIYFKHVSFAGPKIVSNIDKDISKYYLGEEKGEGLIISETEISHTIYNKYIETKDLEKIKGYWQKKVKG